MSRKQSTPRQLHLLREVKRKATAEQEERLQLALARLAQQETVKPQPQHLYLLGTPADKSDKYYAVRHGRISNVIYTSWFECKAQVHQYSGAEYKSFTKYDQARAYLQAKNNDIQPVSRRQGSSVRSENDTDTDSIGTNTVGTQTLEHEPEVKQNFRKFKIASLDFILGVLVTLWILQLLYQTRMNALDLLKGISLSTNLQKSKDSILLAEDQYPENLDPIFGKSDSVTDLNHTLELLKR
jgi:hypothetical protein